jgi:carbamoyltransferase
MRLTAGMSGGARGGAVALADEREVFAACLQERVTRTRGGRLPDSSLPWEALDLLLQRASRSRPDVSRYVVAEGMDHVPDGFEAHHLDHHLAHASTAYLTSPYRDAAIVICDHEAPQVSVWEGRGPVVTRIEWPWSGVGFAGAFSRFARALGFDSGAAEQRAEALGRLAVARPDQRADTMLALGPAGLDVDPRLESWIGEQLAGDLDRGSRRRAALAAGLQLRLGQLLLTVLAEVKKKTGAVHLCVGGSLFYHSSINTLIRSARLFDDVFIPVDPGNTGLAIGAAAIGSARAPSPVSPFLGPSYSPQEIKDVLDNCKLQYAWESEESTVLAAVDALQEGRLVGWLEGGMEWGPRALGARCILANPTAPYVLENLNRFLKHREPWRGYAFSGRPEAVARYFDGPDRAPYMECDYRPKDPAQFRHALPAAEASVRVHTVTEEAPPRFRRLLDAIGQATGLPLVINTSFNGFHEPIVCSPRDAVRVFYGTGLDLLVMDQFVLRK